MLRSVRTVLHGCSTAKLSAMSNHTTQSHDFGGLGAFKLPRGPRGVEQFKLKLIICQQLNLTVKLKLLNGATVTIHN
jgi:hypothetical protein